jgi:hypothetical protein
MEVQQKPFEVLEAELSKYYDIRGREEVREFIEARPYLEAPLLEIPGKIKEYFDFTEKPMLHVVYDVEIPSDTCLAVDVHTRVASATRSPAEERLNEDWWFDVSTSIRQQIALIIY